MAQKPRILTISRAVMQQLDDCFSGTTVELGCLLGSIDRPDRIDRIVSVPGQRDACHFQPDMDAVNRQIRSWAAEGVCFRGLVHSHPGGPPTPSGRDLEAMEIWTRAAGLPFLIFGITAVWHDHSELRFWYSSSLRIQPMDPIAQIWPWAERKWRFPHE